MAVQTFDRKTAKGAVLLPQSITFILGNANIMDVLELPPEAHKVGIYFAANAGHVTWGEEVVSDATLVPATDDTLPIVTNSFWVQTLGAGDGSRAKPSQVAVSSSTGATVVRAFIEGKGGT